MRYTKIIWSMTETPLISKWVIIANWRKSCKTSWQMPIFIADYGRNGKTLSSVDIYSNIFRRRWVYFIWDNNSWPEYICSFFLFNFLQQQTWKLHDKLIKVTTFLLNNLFKFMSLQKSCCTEKQNYNLLRALLYWAAFDNGTKTQCLNKTMETKPHFSNVTHAMHTEIRYLLRNRNSDQIIHPYNICKVVTS
jgi:hypothetical protein